MTMTKFRQKEIYEICLFLMFGFHGLSNQFLLLQGCLSQGLSKWDSYCEMMARKWCPFRPFLPNMSHDRSCCRDVRLLLSIVDELVDVWKKCEWGHFSLSLSLESWKLKNKAQRFEDLCLFPKWTRWDCTMPFHLCFPRFEAEHVLSGTVVPDMSFLDFQRFS